MKNLITFLMLLIGVSFISCDPLEEINAEIDQQEAKNAVVGDISYTLLDEDYEDFFEMTTNSFSSIEDAKSKIPGFLIEKYPVLGVTWVNGEADLKSSATIGYKLYSPIQMETYSVSDTDYQVLVEDGSIQGSYLLTTADFDAFFDYKYAGVQKGTVVNLTYKTLAEKIAYTLTNNDYDLVGNGTYNNFDIRLGKDEETEEVRRVKIETILLGNFSAASIGQQYLITYAAYDGSNIELTMLLEKNSETAYKLIEGYEVTDADFDLVGNGSYDNFDIREGYDEETEESRRVKIETILLNNFPSAIDGQQYLVSYRIWDGADGVLTMLLELDGGTYAVLSQTLVEEITDFTFVNSWSSPVTFSSEEYSLMGQDYPNFSNEDAALYRIAIYLETLYPFAESEDFVAVAYDFYSSGLTTENVNFAFDGTNWNAISTVIDQVIKLGHDGITWVPDNTIKYILTTADYVLVGNGNYKNFDVRIGKDEETEEVRLEKINTILTTNFPSNSVDGQKYTVTYNVYNSGAFVWVMNVVYQDGGYKLQ